MICLTLVEEQCVSFRTLILYDALESNNYRIKDVDRDFHLISSMIDFHENKCRVSQKSKVNHVYNGKWSEDSKMKR